MAKLTQVAEKKMGDMSTHITLFMASVCLQIAKVSFMFAAFFQLGALFLVG